MAWEVLVEAVESGEVSSHYYFATKGEAMRAANLLNSTDFDSGRTVARYQKSQVIEANISHLGVPYRVTVEHRSAGWTLVVHRHPNTANVTCIGRTHHIGSSAEAMAQGVKAAINDAEWNKQLSERLKKGA